MATPAWSAARSGTLGDTGAVDASAQLNQLLGTHGVTAVYQGNALITPFGTGGLNGQHNLQKYDFSQPFVLSGTTVGRVVVPVTAYGTGADLIVTLCADSSGVPGAAINQTRIPANWITELSAVTALPGVQVIPPPMQYTGNPLGVAQFNEFHIGVTAQHAWPYPTSGTGGPSTGPCSCYAGNFFIQMGGSNGSTFFNNVFTIPFDNAGNVSAAVPQQGLPVATDGSASAVVVTEASGTLTVVIAGGGTATGVITNAVYTATFDPAAGSTSAWTTQANLPGTNQYSSMATYNGYVYLAGAANGTFPANGVYYAQVQNGQITAWNAGPSLPAFYTAGQPTGFSYSAASNGFLFVFGGFNGANISACAYAPIHADGSLGNWIQGPNIPTPVAVFNGNPAIVASTYGIMANGGGQLFSLSVSPNGPDTAWQGSDFPSGGNYFAGVETGDGYFQYYGLFSVGLYETVSVALQPRISVPIPTTGLTNGATYHIVMQQATHSDLNNYLVMPDDREGAHLNELSRPIGSATWTPTSSGQFVPIAVYDGSATGPLWHLWEDSGERIVTVVRSTTPNQNVIGVLEATAQPGPVLNMNPTFTSGTAPWVAHGSAVAQSNAFTQGELPFSAKVTPDGVSALSYIESDQVSVLNGHSYAASVWLYSPTGYTPVSMSINWYSAGVYNSTTSTGSLTIAAGVWTQYQIASATVPTGLTNPTATIAPTESGTPAVTAIFYVSAATIQDISGPMLSSVNELTYTGTWPSTGMWPPTGVNELA